MQIYENLITILNININVKEKLKLRHTTNLRYDIKIRNEGTL